MAWVQFCVVRKRCVRVEAAICYVKSFKSRSEGGWRFQLIIATKEFLVVIILTFVVNLSKFVDDI